MRLAQTAQIALRTVSSAQRAIRIPTKTPATTGSTMDRSSAMSTAPFARWDRKERSEVGRMTLSEVPTAR